MKNPSQCPVPLKQIVALAKEHSDGEGFDAEGFSAAFAVALSKASRPKRAQMTDMPSPIEIRRYHELVDARSNGKLTPSQRLRLKALESKFDSLEGKNAPFDKLATAAIEDIDKVLKYHGVED